MTKNKQYCKDIAIELETANLYEYFEDALDIEYRISIDMEYKSVSIMIAYGGPSIYIDTDSKQVELYWWGDEEVYPIKQKVCDEIDEIFEEYYLASKA